MRKHRVLITSKKKKTVKIAGDKQKAQVTDKEEVYEDI